MGPVAGLLVCRRNTSAPPARQAPMTHGAQFVSPSRHSGWGTAWSASGGGGILAGSAGEGGGGRWGQNGSLATRSCSRSRSSCFVFRVAAPARPAATFFLSLTFSVTLFNCRTLYRLLRRLLLLLLRLLHRIRQQGSTVQIGSASRWSARRLAVLSTCRSGSRARR